MRYPKLSTERLAAGLDRAIGVLAPQWALNRMQSRAILGMYEAAQPSRLFRDERSRGPVDPMVARSAQAIAERARFLDENHDLSTGLLTTLTNNIIGARGITIEPQPRLLNGELADGFAEQIADYEKEYAGAADITGEYDRGTAERMLCLSFLRDGNAFQRHYMGYMPAIEHNTKVPYSVELIDMDWLDTTWHDPKLNIVSSVEKDSQGRTTAFWFNTPDPLYGIHPTKRHRVDATFIDHIKLTRRINQTIGVSVLASSLNRIASLKGYEESEEVAARIAAAMVGYVKKGSTENYRGPKDPSKQRHRQFDIAPGMIFDTLQVGEEINTIDHKRPSQLLQSFRDSMIRAISAGTGAAFSSVARMYDKGSYSSQRQEMIESWLNYAVLTSLFIHKAVTGGYQRRVRVGIMAKHLVPPAELDWSTVTDAEYRGPVMPWIDPVQEANGNVIKVQAGFKSISQVIRERGFNPRDTLNQIYTERKKLKQHGVQFPTIADFTSIVDDDDDDIDTPPALDAVDDAGAATDVA